MAVTNTPTYSWGPLRNNNNFFVNSKIKFITMTNGVKLPNMGKKPLLLRK
jgi:hypothetical protein